MNVLSYRTMHLESSRILFATTEHAQPAACQASHCFSGFSDSDWLEQFLGILKNYGYSVDEE